MATLKWKDNKYWQTFLYWAFHITKPTLKNIIIAINNMAKAVRMRCRRDKDLNDIYNAAEGRINLGVLNDCSTLPPSSVSGRASNHHHDSRYIPLIENEERQRKNGDSEIQRAIDALKGKIDSFNNCSCPPKEDGPGGPDYPGPSPSSGPVGGITGMLLHKSWGGQKGACASGIALDFMMPVNITKALIGTEDGYGQSNFYVVPVHQPGQRYILEKGLWGVAAAGSRYHNAEFVRVPFRYRQPNGDWVNGTCLELQPKTAKKFHAGLYPYSQNDPNGDERVDSGGKAPNKWGIIMVIGGEIETLPIGWGINRDQFWQAGQLGSRINGRVTDPGSGVQVFFSEPGWS